MKCQELKNKIVKKSIEFDYLVFVYTDNSFLCDEYIKEIAKIKGLTPTSVDILPKFDAFYENGGLLYVLRTDKFSKDMLQGELRDTIIVCKETDCPDDCLIKFPSLKDWQVLDYIKVKCPGLTEQEVSWLYNTCKGNIYRINQEVNKIKLFPKVEQSNMLNTLEREDNFKDLDGHTIYDLVNAIIKHDRATIASILNNMDVVDIEGTGLVTIMRNNIKNIINIQFNPKATSADLKMKDNQFRAIKYNVGKFTNDELINMLDFLDTIDYNLKSGNLELSNGRLVDYLMCNML